MPMVLKKGEITLEEFRRIVKDYVRVMRHRLDRKRRNLRKILKEIKDEVRLLQEFFSCERLP